MTEPFENTVFYWGYLLEKALGIKPSDITDRNVSGMYLSIHYNTEISRGEHDDITSVPAQAVLSADFADGNISLTLSDMDFPVPLEVTKTFDLICGTI